jgi:hypothetical protein
MRILVTGCGRSGTHYITTVLRVLGLDVGHEVMRRDGMVNWESAKDPKVDLQRAYDIILHQVRHPFPVIEACKGINEHSREMIVNDTSARAYDSHILFGMKYWLDWNQLAQSKAHYTFRVESIPERLREVMAIMGMPTPFDDKWSDLLDIIATIPKSVNSYRDQPESYLKDLTYQDLRKEAPMLAQQITAMARGYGYSVEDLYRNPQK